MELFHHPAWNQCVWQSHEPRYARTEVPLPSSDLLLISLLSCFVFVFFLYISLTGTREAAFVHALSSAALAMAVTRACTRGELEKCGCDRKVRGVSPEGEAGLYCMNIF